MITSISDNSVGEPIPGSTGSPSMGQAIYLALNGPGSSNSDWQLNHLRISYAAAGIVGMDQHPLPLRVQDCQFVQCGYGVATSGGNPITVQNALFAGCLYPIAPGGATAVAVNVTADGCTNFFDDMGSVPGVAATNCLLTGLGQWIGWDPGAGSGTLPPTVLCSSVQSPSSAGVYQIVGGSSYYLCAGSTNRLAGSTNIGALLSDLAQATTYPPIVLPNLTITNPLTLGPQAVRNGRSANVDIGFSYDALDYAVGGCDLYTNLTLSAGTALGWYEDSGHVSSSGQPYALSLNNGANFTSVGTATQPCWIVRTITVQEGGNGNWVTNGWMAGIMINGTGPQAPSPPQLNDHFVKWSNLAGTGNDFRDNIAYGVVNSSDSEYYSGAMASYWGPQYFTNCFFFRVGQWFWDQHDAASFAYQNCTFYDGFLAMCRYAGQSASFWSIENTAFDGTGFLTADNFAGATNHTAFDHNAYNTNNISWTNYPNPYPPTTGKLEVTGPTDKLLGGYNWEVGPLGNYYQPSNSVTIHAGGVLASNVGLYHFTVMTNLVNGLEVKEGTNIVSIGYHYVATDSNGVPTSTSGDAIGDYLLDSNGDGVFDAGDLGNWQAYNSPNGLTTNNNLQVFTPLK